MGGAGILVRDAGRPGQLGQSGRSESHGSVSGGILRRMSARIFLAVVAVAFAPYGILCALNPELLGPFAGVAATSATGTIELRAMYGGLQTAFGLLAFAAVWRPSWVHAALLATAFACAGLGVVRLLGAIAASDFSGYTTTALAFELGSAAIAALLLRGLAHGSSSR